MKYSSKSCIFDQIFSKITENRDILSKNCRFSLKITSKREKLFQNSKNCCNFSLYLENLTNFIRNSLFWTTIWSISIEIGPNIIEILWISLNLVHYFNEIKRFLWNWDNFMIWHQSITKSRIFLISSRILRILSNFSRNLDKIQ